MQRILTHFMRVCTNVLPVWNQLICYVIIQSVSIQSCTDPAMGFFVGCKDLKLWFLWCLLWLYVKIPIQQIQIVCHQAKSQISQNLFAWVWATLNRETLVKTINRFTCLVESKPVEPEVSCTPYEVSEYSQISAVQKLLFNRRRVPHSAKRHLLWRFCFRRLADGKSWTQKTERKRLSNQIRVISAVAVQGVVTLCTSLK